MSGIDEKALLEKLRRRRLGAHVKPGLYWWVRTDDETGMSGTGRVAQVTVWEDSAATLRWLASRNSAGVSSTVHYEHVGDLLWVHGHGLRRTGGLEPFKELGGIRAHVFEDFDRTGLCACGGLPDDEEHLLP